MKRLLVWYLPQAAFFALGASCANAEFYSGNDLHARCRDNRAFAGGYVTGLFDASKVLEIFDDQGVLKICLPAGVMNTQLTDIVCKKLADDPKNRHSTANWLVFDALQEAYPCPKEPKKP